VYEESKSTTFVHFDCVGVKQCRLRAAQAGSAYSRRVTHLERRLYAAL